MNTPPVAHTLVPQQGEGNGCVGAERPAVVEEGHEGLDGEAQKPQVRGKTFSTESLHCAANPLVAFPPPPPPVGAEAFRTEGITDFALPHQFVQDS